MSEETHWVVVGVDGSDDGLRAVHYAMSEAEARGSRLKILHAVDDAILAGTWGAVYDLTELEEAGREAVEAAVQQCEAEGFPRFKIDTAVLFGSPASVLVRESGQADRIVVGRRASSGLERIFVGSTSAAVASAAACPLIMISAATNPGETGGFSRVGVAVGADGPIRGTRAMAWGFEEAALRKAALEIIHVVEPPPPGLFGRARPVSLDQQQAAVDAARAEIDAALVPLREQYPDVPVEVKVTYGSVIDTLVDCSSELDLLILGAHTGGLGQSLGGHVRGLMGHARCPVGIIHPQKL